MYFNGFIFKFNKFLIFYLFVSFQSCMFISLSAQMGKVPTIQGPSLRLSCTGPWIHPLNMSNFGLTVRDSHSLDMLKHVQYVAYTVNKRLGIRLKCLLVLHY